MSELQFKTMINEIIYYNMAELEECDYSSDAEWFSLLVYTLIKRYFSNFVLPPNFETILIERCAEFLSE